MTDKDRKKEITQRIADLEELKAAEEPDRQFIRFVIGVELEELKEELKQLQILERKSVTGTAAA